MKDLRLWQYLFDPGALIPCGERPIDFSQHLPLRSQFWVEDPLFTIAEESKRPEALPSGSGGDSFTHSSGAGPSVLRASSDERKQFTILSDQNYLVEWDGPHDPLNPRNRTATQKWLFVFAVSLGFLLVLVSAAVLLRYQDLLTLLNLGLAHHRYTH